MPTLKLKYQIIYLYTFQVALPSLFGLGATLPKSELPLELMRGCPIYEAANTAEHQIATSQFPPSHKSIGISPPAPLTPPTHSPCKLPPASFRQPSIFALNTAPGTLWTQREPCSCPPIHVWSIGFLEFPSDGQDGFLHSHNVDEGMGANTPWHGRSCLEIL